MPKTSPLPRKGPSLGSSLLHKSIGSAVIPALWAPLAGLPTLAEMKAALARPARKSKKRRKKKK